MSNNSGCSLGCLISIIALIILIIIVGLLIGPALTEIYEIEKAPTISSTTGETFLDMNKIIINIKCNNDYEKVIIKLELYDKDNRIINTEYLIGKNYEEGKTYKLTYSLTAYELIYAKKYSYSIEDYDLE